MGAVDSDSKIVHNLNSYKIFFIKKATVIDSRFFLCYYEIKVI